MKKKRVAIVGTNGIPANYGGFETLAENLTKQLNNKFEFIIYCSKKQKTKIKRYNNSKLVNLPLNANGWQAIMYDIISLFHAWIFADVILILGPTAGFILPLNVIFKKRIIVNHGGLNEWERKKFSRLQCKIILFNHTIASKFAKYRIADNSILAESLKNKFGKRAEIIRYGGDHVRVTHVTDEYCDKYPFLKIPYAVSVSRAQIDNNLHVVLEAFESNTSIKLVLIANWQVSSYGISLKEKYNDRSNIILLDAIYDPVELNLIRGNAAFYIHSHSQCGTAPSLVEVMCLGLPVFSFDVPTNRETTDNKAFYFSDSKSLTHIIESVTEQELTENGKALKLIADQKYSWSNIASQYERLFVDTSAF